MAWQRPDGRQPNQLRPFSFERGFTRNPAGSVLARCGGTHVLCTLSLDESVPRWLKDSGQGWLTAEYRMLPGATQERQRREFMRLSGRTQEIQRLIGRSLRAAIDLDALGEKTLTLDADVIQADGGTRTTSITAGFVALRDAIEGMVSRGELEESPLKCSVAAISVGLIEGEAMLDLDYPEDVAASVDFNVVMTSNLELIEVQGTAEEGAYTREQLNQILDVAEKGIKDLFELQNAVFES